MTVAVDKRWCGWCRACDGQRGSRAHLGFLVTQIHHVVVIVVFNTTEMHMSTPKRRQLLLQSFDDTL